MKIFFKNKKNIKEGELGKELISVITVNAKRAIEALDLNENEIKFQVNFSQKVAKESGVNGFCADENLVKITIDDSRSDLNQVIKERLPETIYHELSHVARIKAVGFGNSFLDVLLTEGLAITFQKKYWRVFCPPWSDYSSDEIEIIFNEIQKSNMMDCEKISERIYSDWFLGHKSDIPKWSGYKYGAYIVEAIMKKSKLSVEKMTIMSTADLVKYLSKTDAPFIF